MLIENEVQLQKNITIVMCLFESAVSIRLLRQYGNGDEQSFMNSSSSRLILLENMPATDSRKLPDAFIDNFDNLFPSGHSSKFSKCQTGVSLLCY